MAITNRDIYLKIGAFQTQFTRIPSLENFLKALWQIVSQSKVDGLSIENVLVWLEAAFTKEPPAYDHDWENIEFADQYDNHAATYQDWENTVLYQIVDLHQMAEAGSLANAWKYGGMAAPRGQYWYNFDPLTYLECGIRGIMGGFEASEVIVLVPSPEGQSDDSPVFPVKNFSWYDFIGLLVCGQIYE